MKKIILVSSVILLVLLVGSCAGVPTVPAFYEKTANHRIIAILPFEMVFTGSKPKKITFAQVQKIEEIESISFQKSFRYINRRIQPFPLPGANPYSAHPGDKPYFG